MKFIGRMTLDARSNLPSGTYMPEHLCKNHAYEKIHEIKRIERTAAVTLGNSARSGDACLLPVRAERAIVRRANALSSAPSEAQTAPFSAGKSPGRCVKLSRVRGAGTKLTV